MLLVKAICHTVAAQSVETKILAVIAGKRVAVFSRLIVTEPQYI